MITNKHIAIAALLLTLAIPALGDPGQPKERLVAGYASAKWVFWPNGSVETAQTGVANLLGAFTGTGFGAAGLSDFNVVLTAANGDQVFGKLTPGGPYEVTASGGTGRFEGATGGINTTWESERIYTFYPDGTMTMEVTYTFAGAITY